MVREATQADALALAELAIKLWSSHTISELQSEFLDLICSDNAVCFIKYVGSKAVGFAQCQLRNDYVEGTDTSPVGYLEGILLRKNIGIMDMLKNFFQNAKNGLKKNIVLNLQVIVKSTMK